MHALCWYRRSMGLYVVSGLWLHPSTAELLGNASGWGRASRGETGCQDPYMMMMVVVMEMGVVEVRDREGEGLVEA